MGAVAVKPWHQRLWRWLTRGEPGVAVPIALLIVGLVLGCVTLLAAIVSGMAAKTAAEGVLFVPAVAGGGSFGWGFVVGFILPRQAVLWSAGFAGPMLVWGLICLPFAILDGPDLLLWLMLALAMVALSAVGVVLARRARCWLVEK